MKDFNVLITGCSRFSKEIIDCLKNNEDGAHVKVVGVDCNPNNLLHTNVDFTRIVPRITEASYIDTLIGICCEYDVKIILPYITSELELLSANKEKFAKYGIKVSVMDQDILAIANNKIKLQQRFPQFMPKQDIATNKAAIEKFAMEVGYPEKMFCCKLSDKCGGQGFAIVNDEKANDLSCIGVYDTKKYVTFEHLCKLVENTSATVMLQEYVEGYDYSVCLVADKGKIVGIVGYIGYTMAFGAVMRGEIFKNDKAYRIAEQVSNELCLDGNICMDFIIRDKEATLLEINPRINATVPFCAKAGVNLPYIRCKQLLGEPICQQKEPNYGLKMNKFYEAEYFV